MVKVIIFYFNKYDLLGEIYFHPINKPYTTIKTFLIDKPQTFKLLTIFAI